MPNNCIFLVDTYNSIDGIRHAIEIGSELRRQGHEMIGVRLDSGDRVALSIKARRMLDEAGFANAKIVCSGDLDEYMITDLKQRGAKIDVWGVGTKLSTGQPDAALGGIYKLGAIRRPGGEWQYRIKLSEESAKASVPGSLQVRRFHQPDGRFMADAIYETDHGVSEPCEIVDPETNDRLTIGDASAIASVGKPSASHGTQRRPYSGRHTLPICWCRSSGAGNLFMNRRALRRRASTCVNSSVARLPRFCG